MNEADVLLPGIHMNRTGQQKIKILIVSFICLVLLTVFSNTSFSHPHVFMTQQIISVFDDKGLAGFKIRWEFGDMFSSMIAADYDRNQNGFLEKDEVAVVKDEAFSYISEYNYFIFVKIDGKPFEVKFIKDFSAILDNGELIYTFFVPCHVRAISNFKQIIVATYDPSYYSAILFKKKDPAVLENNELFEVKAAIREDKSTSIYFDMVNPWALFLDFRTKQ
ncbi:MAG: DUF1007 family protein [Desulfobacteraceae bacterium]|nr:DUF1007 family protein [Desulfobacteraceae bacterium]MBC2755426.1 DUF1007 family protein [Desulfobacteraceae bacterium]